MRRDVRNWLSPPDPWKNQNLANESRHSGSGSWWIESDAYAEWKSSGPSSLLWINGKRQYLALILFHDADMSCFRSGCRKECHLVRESLNLSYSQAYAVG